MLLRLLSLSAQGVIMILQDTGLGWHPMVSASLMALGAIYVEDL